jgi:hypothetical protein
VGRSFVGRLRRPASAPAAAARAHNLQLNGVRLSDSAAMEVLRLQTSSGQAALQRTRAAQACARPQAVLVCEGVSAC